MKSALLAATLLMLPLATHAEEKASPTAPAPAEAAKPAEAPKNPEAVDISGLEEDYWRPNKDELEVVQNRRFDKKGRWEAGLHYGFYQGQDFKDSRSLGASVTYNFSNTFFTELSYHKVNSSKNEFLSSVQRSYGFTPDFNTEQHQTVLSGGWVPIYAKFSLLGKKISHFEQYFAPGIGITKTVDNHVSGHFTIGQKYFLTEHLLFRIEWRISKYKDKVPAAQGTAARRNGGPGFTEPSETTHNIIFGLGVLF